MKLLLTLETSTPVEHVALLDGGSVIAESRDTVGRGHTETLLATVDSVLSRAGVGVEELSAVIVSIGPGRFSGLRVGLATAKGLSASSGVPVVPVETLPALALSGAPHRGLVCPMLDARRGEIYGALFRRGQTLERLLADAALPPAALLEEVRDLSGGEEVLFLGTGAVVAADEISATMGAGALFAEPPVDAPEPLAMATLAAAAGPPRGSDAETLEPVYLRGI